MTKFLNRLPIIIDGPGVYRMRNGKLVRLEEIDPETPPGQDGFLYNARGWTHSLTKGKWVKRQLALWHISGRLYSHRESPGDITVKLPETTLRD